MKRALLVVGLLCVAWFARGGFYAREAREYRAAVEPVGDELVELNGHAYGPMELGMAHARSFLPSAETPDRIEPVVDFARRLEARGVELWVLPVPPRPMINAREIRGWGAWGPPTSIYTTAWSDYVQAMKDRGVTVIDVLPTYQAGAAEDPSAWIHEADGHWTNTAAVAAARAVADRLRRYGLTEGLTPIQTSATWKEIEKGASPGHQGVEAVEITQVRTILREDGNVLPQSDPESPILVFGDSHIGWFSKWNADFARQVAHEVASVVDVLEVQGGGASRSREELARRSWSEPDFLAKKRVAIWVYQGARLQEDEWRIVRLDRFPIPRIEAHERRLHLPTDRVFVDRGVPLVPTRHRWRGPRATGLGDDTLWLWTRSDGKLVFSSPPGGELLLEVVGKDEAREVDFRIDGKPIRKVRIPAGGPTRVRLNLRRMGAGEKTLRIEVDVGADEKRRRTRIGLHRMAWVAPRTRTRTTAAQLEWTPGASFTHAIDKDVISVRFGVHSLSGPGEVTLKQEGRVLAEIPVDGDSVEHAVMLLDHDAEGTLEWSMADGRFLVDWVEVDGPPRSKTR